jgi:hypothetical protein
MKRLLSLTLVILAVSLLSCSGQRADFPEVDGWTLAGDVMTYDADNLWEYINGAAELFLEYDVQTCRTADLSSGDLLVTVDLYDMGAPLNAFGTFNREHPAAGSPLPGATKAVVSPPYQALLLKGATYVKVNAVEGELTSTSGRQLLEALARALPGQADHPLELDLLPQNGRVAGSEGYVREGFLGLTELSHCLYADYAGADGQTWEGFVMLTAPGSSPAAVWESLADIWASVEHEGRTVLYKEIPYRGLAGVVQTDRSIVGATGASDQAELLTRLEALVR